MIIGLVMTPRRNDSIIMAATKKRYSDTTIQRYRNRNLEPEPGTGTWNRA
jgi:hypothetical protein